MKELIHRQSIGLLILLMTSMLFIHSEEDQTVKSELERNFISPPLEYRPLAFWDWLNGYVDTTRLVYELKEMKEKGMQGALIWDVGALIDPDRIIPAGPAFMGEESLRNISLALRTSGHLGLNLGMITSSSWNAGGDWITETDGIKEILTSNQVVYGPSKNIIIIDSPIGSRGRPKVYSLISSIAVPYTQSKQIDFTKNNIVFLDDYTRNGKYIQWDVPDGKWDIISFFICNTGQELVCPAPNSKGLMIDHLSKQATKVHFDTLLTRLNKISSSGNRLKYLEVDSYEAWTTKDWTPGFIEEFRIRYGYDLKPYLPLLLGYKSLDSTMGIRFVSDYKRLVSDLMIENHFKQATTMVNQQGIQLFAEAGHGGSPRVEPLKALGNTDIPMGEFWNRQRHWVTKEASSAAHIYGKKIVASESLTSWQHWQHGPTDYKQLCDVAFCEGLNQVFFHTFAHNPSIAGKPGFAYHAGEHFNTNTTWWSMTRPFMDYLGRCSYMLRQGHFVADVLLYYGDDAPNLVPPKRMDPNYTPDMPGIFPHWFYDETKCPHCGQIKPINPGNLPGYDYDYINADIITTTLTSKKGNLVMPQGQSYRVMMIPDRKDISLEVLKSIEKLIHEGAVVIGPKPERSTSLKNYPGCDEEVKAIADKIWGNCDGKTHLSNQYGKGKIYWGKTLQEVIHELKINPDFEVSGIDNADNHIDYIHRKTSDEDIYFISNSSQSIQHFNTVFRVQGNKVPEIWDAETGLIQRNVKYSKINNGISMEFVMDPLASRFVVFKSKSKEKNSPGLHYNLQFGFDQNTEFNKKNKTIDISYHWTVKFNPEMGGTDSLHLDSLVSWTEVKDERVKFYSGLANYETDFTVSRNELSKETKAFVVFENIQEMARVFVNGKDCGIVWTIPYKADISDYIRVGSNHITIQVINTWNNRIVGDVRHPLKKQYTRTNIRNKFKASSPLLKSGLMGKAKIFLMN